MSQKFEGNKSHERREGTKIQTSAEKLFQSNMLQSFQEPDLLDKFFPRDSHNKPLPPTSLLESELNFDGSTTGPRFLKYQPLIPASDFASRVTDMQMKYGYPENGKGRARSISELRQVIPAVYHLMGYRDASASTFVKTEVSKVNFSIHAGIAHHKQFTLFQLLIRKSGSDFPYHKVPSLLDEELEPIKYAYSEFKNNPDYSPQDLASQLYFAWNDYMEFCCSEPATYLSEDLKALYQPETFDEFNERSKVFAEAFSFYATRQDNMFWPEFAFTPEFSLETGINLAFRQNCQISLWNRLDLVTKTGNKIYVSDLKTGSVYVPDDNSYFDNALRLHEEVLLRINQVMLLAAHQLHTSKKRSSFPNIYETVWRNSTNPKQLINLVFRYLEFDVKNARFKPYELYFSVEEWEDFFIWIQAMAKALQILPKKQIDQIIKGYAYTPPLL